MESLYESLQQYGMSEYYPYHMPGHKRRLGGILPKELIQADITEIEGFDNLHQPEGILSRLQADAARLYGAEETYYLVNGSTCGILSAVSAVLPEGGHLLMCRNCHKSAYHAAYLRKLTVSYLFPDFLQEYDICEAVSALQVRQALEQSPDIRAVLIVSPTYEGRIAPIEEIAQVVHERHIPLIVDEAHGAHLGFGMDGTGNSCRQGADLVINSVHKTLPALTQTALLHVNGSLVNRDRLRRFLHIYQSSSPSYILMASIDNAMQIVKKDGKHLFRNLSIRWFHMLKELSICNKLMFLPPEPGKQDIGKLVISTRKTDLSGKQLYDMLLNNYRLQLEMAEGSYCLAMFTIGDDEEGFQRLTSALLDIDTRIGDRSGNKAENGNSDEGIAQMGSYLIASECQKTSVALPLWEAWDSSAEEYPLTQCKGRLSAEFIYLYPPGIPIVIPGEVLTEERYNAIEGYLTKGLCVQGIHLSVQGPMIRVIGNQECMRESVNMDKKGLSE